MFTFVIQYSPCCKVNHYSLFNLYIIMKIKSLLLGLSAGLMVFTSCNDKDEPDQIASVTYSFSVAASDLTDDGYWNQVYNTGVGNSYWKPDLQLTHKATETVYDGVTYKSWMGFCPSESADTKDYSDGDWMAHQWTAITGKGAGMTPGYIVGFWDVNESKNGIPEPVTCGLGTASTQTFLPQSIYVTNTTWSYYAMLNGSSFNKKFTAEDWCKLTIIGLNGYVKTGEIDVYLAKDGKILDTWEKVDLTSLGECNVLYFQMSSTDTGQWGMNNPAYFCIDDFTAIYRY